MSTCFYLIQPALSRIGLTLAVVALSLFGGWCIAKADETLPSSIPDFPSIIRAHSDQLGKLESDKGAGTLFVSAIGPALQLGDAARTLGTYPLPAKLANELLVPDLTSAVHRLMSSLAAWRLASITSAGCERSPTRTCDRGTAWISTSQGVARSTRERTLA